MTIFLLFVLVISGCSKEDDKGVESLPPATQTGARTFGCLVDGNAFIDTGAINCFYQYVDGGYYFAIHGKNDSQNPSGITLGTSRRIIAEGETVQLLEAQHGNASASAFFKITQTSGESSATSSIYNGELTITKLDYENNIVSGTFWFDVEHPETGERVEITEGRFDTYFSQ